MAMTFTQRTTMKAVAPLVLNLIDKIDAQSQANADIKSVGNTLEKLLESKPDSQKLVIMKQLNDAMAANPKMAQQIEQVLAKNPKALEAALPGIVNNPTQSARLVDELSTRVNAPAQSAPAGGNSGAGKPPATAGNGRPEPIPAVVAPVRPPAPAAGAPAPQQPPKPPAAGTPPQSPPAAAAPPAPAAGAPESGKPPAAESPAEQANKAKLLEIEKAEGYKEFYEYAMSGKNPALQQSMLNMMMGSNNDPKKTGQAYDAILNQLKSDPKMFVNLKNTIEQKPGLTTSLLNSFGDSGMGMKALVGYSNFMNSGFGKMLDGILGPGKLDNMLTGLLDMVKGMFGKGGPLTALSNNGGGLTQLVTSLTGATPPKLSVVGPTGTGREMTGAQVAEAAAAEQQAAEQRRAAAPAAPTGPN